MPTTISLTALIHISEPRFNYLDNGTAVCNLSGAANLKHRGEESTVWIETSLWGARGEAAHDHLSKGDLILVTGTVIQQRIYERDGVLPDAPLEERVGVTLVIKASDVTFVSVQKWKNGDADENGWEAPAVNDGGRDRRLPF